MVDDTQFKELEDKFNNLYKYCEREFQFVSCLEKGIDAFEIASNYLTDRELKAIGGIFECIIDIIDKWGDEANKEEKSKTMLEHMESLSDPEKKEVINTFLLGLREFTPTPRRERSADKNVYLKGCRPPRPCYELKVMDLLLAFRNR